VEDILVGVHSLVVGSPGAEGSLDVAVGSQGSHDRMEGPRVLLDDQACTCGVGPSAGQGNPGDPALLPSNYSCLDRCLRLHRLPVVEALRLLLPPWAGRWLGTWISMRKILWVKVRALDVGLDSASPRQPAPLPRETQADRRRCPPFPGCPVSVGGLLLPCVPERVLGASTLMQVALHVYWVGAGGHPRGLHSPAR